MNSITLFGAVNEIYYNENNVNITVVSKVEGKDKSWNEYWKCIAFAFMAQKIKDLNPQKGNVICVTGQMNLGNKEKNYGPSIMITGIQLSGSSIELPAKKEKAQESEEPRRETPPLAPTGNDDLPF